jgi:hypothetical protein
MSPEGAGIALVLKQDVEECGRFVQADNADTLMSIFERWSGGSHWRNRCAAELIDS